MFWPGFNPTGETRWMLFFCLKMKYIHPVRAIVNYFPSTQQSRMFYDTSRQKTLGLLLV